MHSPKKVVYLYSDNNNIKIENMTTQLESTKAINSLKAKATKKGGYLKFKNEILSACAKHKELFGSDLTPKHLV